MKVLAISMGRKNERSDIYAKQVLMGVEAAAKETGKDVEVEFVNTVTMNIGQCRGCGVCSKAPDGKIKCILPDDYLEIEEKILDADGIIIAAPVYSVYRFLKYSRSVGSSGKRIQKCSIGINRPYAGIIIKRKAENLRDIICTNVLHYLRECRIPE